MKKYRKKEWLEEEFVDKNRTIKSISEECSVYPSTISRWIDRHGLSDKETEKCSACGDEYKSLSHHWHYQSECRPNLSSRQVEIVKGCLLGDGCLMDRDSGRPRFQLATVNIDFLKWFDSVMGVMSNGVRKRNNGDEIRDKMQKYMHKDISHYDFSDFYICRTKPHPTLQMFSDWYSSGIKEIPKGIHLTPMVLKCWFVCDGTVRDNKNSSHFSLSLSEDFADRETLYYIFENSSLPKPSRWWKRENEIGSSAAVEWDNNDTHMLMEYMGEPLPGFEYKWR